MQQGFRVDVREAGREDVLRREFALLGEKSLELVDVLEHARREDAVAQDDLGLLVVLEKRGRLDGLGHLLQAAAEHVDDGVPEKSAGIVVVLLVGFRAVQPARACVACAAEDVLRVDFRGLDGHALEAQSGPVLRELHETSERVVVAVDV